MSAPAVTREWADRISDLYRRIASVTTAYTFTRPVADDDVETVRAELAAAVPECTVLATVDSLYSRVTFDVALGDRPIYRRHMIIHEVQ